MPWRKKTGTPFETRAGSEVVSACSVDDRSDVLRVSNSRDDARDVQDLQSGRIDRDDDKCSKTGSPRERVSPDGSIVGGNPFGVRKGWWHDEALQSEPWEIADVLLPEREASLAELGASRYCHPVQC